MVEAAWWGLIGGCSLVLGALLVFVRAPGRRALGAVMGFGAGVLVSAVSFELVEKAVSTADGLGTTALGLFAGALVFFAGDVLIGRVEGRADLDSSRSSSTALPIVLGTVLDGIPESAVLGLTLLQTGDIGLSMLVAVFVSNIPEAVAATADLRPAGWSRRRIVALWTSVAAVSGAAAAIGYGLLDGAAPGTIAFMFAFAGGAILAMLSTSMIPEAYELAGRPTGLLVTLGFAVSFGITWLGE